MKLGVFLPMEPHTRSPRESYAFFVRLAQECEELGYDSMWVASRHFSPDYAAIPSPFVLLAAAASRTTKILLGTSVVSMPLENPIRLAEDFATLDSVTEGRARLGVGSGDDPPAFAAMGADFDSRQRSTSERLIRLLGLLDGETAGGMRLFPEVEEPRSKVALGAQSPGGAAWAGQLGVGLMQGRAEPQAADPTPSQAAAAAAYREANPNGWIVTARNAWIGSVYDPELAEGLQRHGSYLEGRGRTPLPSDYPLALAKLNIIAGEPGELAAKLRDSVAPINPDVLAVTVDPGGLPEDEVKKRLRLLAEVFL